MRQDNRANTADSCQDREHERSSLVLVVLLLVIVLATSSWWDIYWEEIPVPPLWGR